MCFGLRVVFFWICINVIKPCINVIKTYNLLATPPTLRNHKANCTFAWSRQWWVDVVAASSGVMDAKHTNDAVIMATKKYRWTAGVVNSNLNSNWNSLHVFELEFVLDFELIT